MGGYEILLLIAIVAAVLAVSSRRSSTPPLKECPHCGAQCSEPTNPERFLCCSCQRPGPWATEVQARSWNQTNELRERLEEILARVAGGEPEEAVRGALEEVASAYTLPAESVRQAKRDAYANFVKQFIQDELLTEAERSVVETAGTLVGLNWRDIADYNYDLYDLLFSAWVRATGPRRVRESPSLPLAPNELLAYEFSATLHEQVPVQAFSATTGDVGLSVPLGKTGAEIETRVGGLAGTTTQVGTEERTDSGKLFLTTRRVVFLGARRTIDIPIEQVTAVKTPPVVSLTSSRPRRLMLHAATAADNLEFSLLGAQIAAATIEWMKNPPPVEAEPALQAPAADAEYSLLDAREFAKVVKDPEGARGRLLTLYGRVIQFDTATGPEALLCYCSGERIAKGDGPKTMQYSENRACIRGSQEILADVVEGDFFEAGARVVGVFAYKNGLGGSVKCPEFVVGRISVYDSLKS